jgi:hypothetical protein
MGKLVGRRLNMVKVSKAGKARLKRMSAAERKAILKSAMLLADSELITSKRFEAIHRIYKSC